MNPPSLTPFFPPFSACSSSLMISLFWGSTFSSPHILIPLSSYLSIPTWSLEFIPRLCCFQILLPLHWVCHTVPTAGWCCHSQLLLLCLDCSICPDCPASIHNIVSFLPVVLILKANTRIVTFLMVKTLLTRETIQKDIVTVISAQVAQDEAATWEMEGRTGFLRLDYDPVTQVPLKPILNSVPV